MGLPEGVLLADIDAMNVFRTQNVYAQEHGPMRAQRLAECSEDEQIQGQTVAGRLTESC